LKQLPGKFELVTHLHPEFIEPQKSEFNYAGKKGEANCCFLDPVIEFEKIKSITELFKEQFNYSPASFRAGRFSAGANTIRSLARLGYKTDTSVTPHVKWNDKTRKHPVDFSNAKEQPYFIKPGTILEEDYTGPLLEIPVTISVRKTSLVKELKRTYLGLRHGIESYRPLWLRPVFSNLENFIDLTEEYGSNYKNNETLVYNMMFHNVEVMPGLSPYTRTENDCTAYMNQLEKYFIYCTENNIRGITLSDVYNLYR
jgi:hypothetical protein